MSLLIKESKRDELLFPYMTYLHENGIDVSLAEFKSAILKKLANEAGIRNLSQRSNYYLAGAARYYFHGDLTTNNPVSLLSKGYWSNGGFVNDDWNEDICKRLNALIGILRNQYIDSVGETFEQPEDFGKLSLKQLFRKYGKKIDKELGVKKDEDTLNTDENVGKGYTFEIMYSQADCQKYERPTAPGSWCITYGQNHYNSYVRSLDIHYVIFRQNGWENIPRPSNPENEPGFTREKPHDAFGNSLIALLQSNTSPEPVYITSRWNHGYEVRCEADHAYTKEEFEQITGVTDDDLARIFEIWKRNRNTKTSNSEMKKRAINVTRAFKYAQMRINAGENPEAIFNTTSIIFQAPNGKFNKSTATVSLDVPGYGVNYALFDNGKVIFETIDTNVSLLQENPDIVVCDAGKYTSYYNRAKHKLISIDGTTKFKHTISGLKYRRIKDFKYIMVKQSTHDIALLDAKTFEPLKLPNGECWFNDLIARSYDITYYTVNVKCTGLGESRDDVVIQIVYDASSNETYFYNIDTKQFIPTPTPPEGFAKRRFGNINPEITNDMLIPKLNRWSSLLHGYFSVSFVLPRNFGGYARAPYIIYDPNGKMITLDGHTEVLGGDMGYDRFISPIFDANDERFIYDLKTGEKLTIFGRPITIAIQRSPFRECSNGRYLGIIVSDRNAFTSESYVYDMQLNKFLVKRERDGSDNDYLFYDLRSGGDTFMVRENGYMQPIEEVIDNKNNNSINTNDIESMVNEAVFKILKRLL